MSGLKQRVILISIVVLWGSLIRSQDDWTLSVTNDIDFTTRYYPKSNSAFLDGYLGEIRTFHDLKMKYKSKLALHLSGRSNLNINNSSRNRAWYNEANVSWRHKNLSLKVGKQIIKWGSITGVSAMDMVNRYDYYDYLSTDREHLGIWAAKLRYNTGPINWTFQIGENNNQSKLHFDQNRWTRMPTAISIPQDSENIFSLELEHIDIDNKGRGPQISLEGDFDIETVSSRFFAYSGSNDIPQRALNINLIEDKSVTYDLALQYHDLQIFGIGQSTYLSDWNVWYELSNIRNQRALLSGGLVKDNYWNFTFGVDRIFNFESPEKSVKWILQYCNIIGASDDSYGPTDLDHVFSNSILTELQYTHNYNWKVDLRSVMDLGKKGVYFNPRVKYLVSDQLHIELSSDILLGSDRSFWGHYNDNSRLSFQVKYVIL